jgi:hypothetical protein
MNLFHSKKFWPSCSAVSLNAFVIFTYVACSPNQETIYFRIYIIMGVIPSLIILFIGLMGLKTVLWKWWREDINTSMHKQITGLSWFAILTFVFPAYFTSPQKNAAAE